MIFLWTPGAKEFQVAIQGIGQHCAEAEELFLRLYQGDGYQNTTGMTAAEAKSFFGGKANTYHWDDQVGSDGRLLGHAPGSPDAQYRHLQIHTEDEIIRIFYGEPLTWP